MEQPPFLNKGDPVPQNLAECADYYNGVRNWRFEIQHKLEEIESREREIRDYLIAQLEAQQLGGVSGKTVSVKLKPKRKPFLEDWNQFTAWVLKTGLTDCLYKRVSSKAIESMEENGDALPDGVTMANSVDLSVSKIK